MPNVNEKLTFGIELEGVTATPQAAQLSLNRHFTKRFDHSIKNDDGTHLPPTLEAGGGFEFITPPQAVEVRMNNVGDHLAIVWGDTLNVVRDLCGCVDHVNRSCGVHIHIGRPSKEGLFASKWEPERVRTMLTIGMMLENRVFDVMPDSRRGNHHCNTIRSRYSDNDLGQFYPVGNVTARKYSNIKRYCWMNLIETRRVGNDTRPGRGSSEALGTIEIRALGNTKSFDYIMTWLQLWIRVAAYVAYLPSSLAIMRCCMTPTFDDDFLLLSKLKSHVNESIAPTAEPPTVHSRRSERRTAQDPWEVDPINEAQNIQ